ncbi:mannosyl-N-acetyl-alpha-D-glucosaminyl-diphospho-ditrans,octacis-undecaprenol 3-alpha-mannosyltransferase / alpha-1,3-rhamnosyltransferase [Burkholderiales bacterium]|nr:MAG: glycosyltransferase family 4 protein [Burkholderiales bacterium]CAG0948412.1 mannosyl-N-acetyl-alpha-D-glucosaminyl-diphospho-ditrans,octacis-undecaprenol 3-alpha-mannosyltransferase / alpha-1,3-rhamnosyltransferase [Burkholderiales bacterium]
MRVALTLDAVDAPLTGVGRYALELATRLPALGADVSYLTRTGVLSEGAFTERRLMAARGQPRRGPILQSLLGSANQFPFMAHLAHSMRSLRDSLLPALECDLVHGTGYYLPAARKQVAIVSFHDLSPLRFPQWHLPGRAARLASEMRQAASRADWIITDSNAVKAEVLDEFGFPAQRVVAIPLGVDAVFRQRAEHECVEVLQPLGLEVGGYSLMVGTLEPRKNHEKLLAAYAGLPLDARKAWPLVIVGGHGWANASVNAAIERGVREGWVKRLGFVAAGTLPILYSGARLFVYPSLYEGFGLPLIEAMASGVPVVTSNRGSLAETAGAAGELVDPEDVASIRQGIERGLEDASWRETSVRNGLEIARQRTWSSCARQTLALYHLAVSGQRLERAPLSNADGDCAGLSRH